MHSLSLSLHGRVCSYRFSVNHQSVGSVDRVEVDMASKGRPHRQQIHMADHADFLVASPHLLETDVFLKNKDHARLRLAWTPSQTVLKIHRRCLSTGITNNQTYADTVYSQYSLTMIC